MDGKACAQCKRTLPLDEFSPSKKGGKGVHAHCHKCNAANKRAYRAQNKELLREQDRERYKRDREKRLEAVRTHYRANKEKISARRRILRSAPGRKAVAKAWWTKNWGKKKKYEAIFLSKPENRMRRTITSRIIKCLRNGKENKSLQAILGYSMLELRRHLESNFSDGMEWENYGLHGWHIDHIIPVSSFNFSSIEDWEFKKCFSLENLQPLWAYENLAKSNKVLEV